MVVSGVVSGTVGRWSGGSGGGRASLGKVYDFSIVRYHKNLPLNGSHMHKDLLHTNLLL